MHTEFRRGRPGDGFRRPNVNPGVPLELYRSGYTGGKVFNRAAFTAPPAGQQAILGAMCCGVLELSRRILASNGDFGSPSKWGFDSGGVLQYLESPELRDSRHGPGESAVRPLDTNADKQSGIRLEGREDLEDA
jgi:hypothetical protein